MPSLLIVAGDPSGDAHAARLITTLRRQDPALAVTALGGPALQRAGATLLADLTQSAAIGPVDAARHLARFARAKRLLETHLTTQRPDAAILVDFGDFNLPIVAPLVKRHGVPLLYYISPQVWAWGRWRVRLIRRYIDQMVVFFRFEEEFYRAAGVPVTWVGHPLLDEAASAAPREPATQALGLNPWRRTVGLLPGSRGQEVARHLPLMLAAAERMAWHMPGLQFLLLKAPALPDAALQDLVRRAPISVRLATAPAPEALALMDAAVVASGTATLETALAGVPMVVIYRASWPTYLAARLALRIPRIAMVNVVAQRAVVPELLQHQATPARIADTLLRLLRDDEACHVMREGLQEVRRRLGPPGAVDRAARAVTELLAARPAAAGSVKPSSAA
jgi:lipid-A-disaccharide synthase